MERKEKKDILYRNYNEVAEGGEGMGVGGSGRGRGEEGREGEGGRGEVWGWREMR